MTQPPTQPAGPPVPYLVRAEGTTRLAQLHADYADAKANADAAAARLKSVVDGIKSELTQAAPDQQAVELVDPAGYSLPLRLTYVESWRINTDALKAEQPYVYAKYAKKSGSWRLAPVKPGKGGEQG